MRSLFLFLLAYLVVGNLLASGQRPLALSTRQPATNNAAWLDSVNRLPLAQQVAAVRTRAWRDTLLAPYQPSVCRVIVAEVLRQANASAGKLAGYPLLYVLDDQAFYNNSAASISQLQQQLDKRPIRQVTLLYGVAATSIYGARAANGMVVLSSKPARR